MKSPAQLYMAFFGHFFPFFSGEAFATLMLLRYRFLLIDNSYLSFVSSTREVPAATRVIHGEFFSKFWLSTKQHYLVTPRMFHWTLNTRAIYDDDGQSLVVCLSVIFLIYVSLSLVSFQPIILTYESKLYQFHHLFSPVCMLITNPFLALQRKISFPHLL